jgi:hypothetical protein
MCCWLAVKVGFLNRAVETLRLALLRLLQVIQPLDEEQIGDLLDHRQRVTDAVVPEGGPELVYLRFQLAGDHGAQRLSNAVPVSISEAIGFGAATAPANLQN